MDNLISSSIDVITDYLLVGSVTAMILAVLAWVIIKVGRIKAPVYRHMIWLYSLTGIAVLPLIWLHVPKLTVAVLNSRAEPVKVTSPEEIAVFKTIDSTIPGYNSAIDSEPSGLTDTPIPYLHEEKIQTLPIKTILAGVWFVGFVIMLGRLCVGWCQLRRICLKATPAPQREYTEYTAGRKLKILLTSEISGPVCFGVIHPVIVLPREMYENSIAKDLKMVLTHEWAHIKRMDCFTNFFQRILEAVFFFHPLVWLASRQLTQQREQICDNYVLAKGASSDDYTTLLSHIGEQALGRTSLQTVALYEGQLLYRVRSLLDPLHSFRTKIPRWSAITWTTVVLVGFFASGSVRLGAKPIPEAFAGTDTERMEASKERVVHFPKNKSLGKLEIQDENATRELTYWFHWTGIKGPQWEYLGQAQGDVLVPAGKRLSLFVDKTAWRDLSALSKLRPDDLYRLYLPALSLTDRVKPDDKCMPHIAHLTGLRSVALDRTNITYKGLKYLANLSSLEYLGLPYRITDKGMAHIAKLSSLKRISLPDGGRGVTNAGLRHLANLTSLEEVYLVGESIGDAGLAHLRGLPRLKYLALSGNGFTDKGIVHLKDIPSLRILSFREGQPGITDAGLAHISDIPNLEILCLSGMKAITDEGLAHLRKMRSLRKLQIGDSQVTDKGLSYLSQIKTLERIDLPQDQHGITDTGLAHLGTLPNLRHLAISRIHFIDPKMNKEYYTDKGLAELVKCRQMEELYIGSPGITDEGMRHVARLTNLKVLMLSGCENISNKGLARLTTLQSLKHLSITESKITLGGLTHLNKIPGLYKLDLHDIEQDHSGLDISGLTSLEELNLGLKIERVDWENKSVISQKFTAADLVCLSKLKNLRWLQGINNITDNGLKKLSGLTNMERFSFTADGLTDDGLKSLANMKNLDLLSINNKYPEKTPDFSRRILTHEGLRHLEGLKMLTLLRIDSDNNFSDSAVRRLRRGLPNLYSLNINDSNGQPIGMGARASAVRQPQRPVAGRRPVRSARAVREDRTRRTTQR